MSEKERFNYVHVRENVVFAYVHACVYTFMCAQIKTQIILSIMDRTAIMLSLFWFSI